MFIQPVLTASIVAFIASLNVLDSCAALNAFFPSAYSLSLSSENISVRRSAEVPVLLSKSPISNEPASNSSSALNKREVVKPVSSYAAFSFSLNPPYCDNTPVSTSLVNHPSDNVFRKFSTVTSLFFSVLNVPSACFLRTPNPAAVSITVSLNSTVAI